MTKKKVADFLQSLLLIFLFAVLLGQCAFYIRLAENLGGTGLEPFPDSELMLLGKQQDGNNSSYLISPCFTAVIPKDKHGSGNYLPMSEGSDGREIWKYFTETIKSSVKGTAKQIIFADVEEKKSYLDALYTECTECYYVKFAKGIEFSVLALLLSDTYEQLPDNPDFLISDMFLTKGSNGECSVVAVDKFGEVLKIFPSRNVSFNNELVETYTNTDADSFEFVNIASSDFAERNGYFPVLIRSLSSAALQKSELEAFVSLGDFGSDSDSILKAFGMNKDNTKSYVNSDGDYMFIENTTRLRVGKNGNIVYTPENGGTPISDILSYSGNVGSDGFGEIAMLSKSVAAELSDLLYLCDGNVTLYDVSYNGTILSFVFRYTAGGIPITDNDDEGKIRNALRLDFERDKLVYAEMNVIPYRFSGTVSTDMPQRTAYAILSSELSQRNEKSYVEYFGAEYLFASESDTSSLVFGMKTEKEAE